MYRRKGDSSIRPDENHWLDKENVFANAIILMQFSLQLGVDDSNVFKVIV